MKRKISIIGSTGSIGTQALEVIEKLQDKFEIIALACGHNEELLKKQAEKFHPKYTVLGEDGLEKICSDKENDITKWSDANRNTILEIYEAGRKIPGIEKNSNWVKRVSDMDALEALKSSTVATTEEKGE